MACRARLLGRKACELTCKAGQQGSVFWGMEDFPHEIYEQKHGKVDEHHRGMDEHHRGMDEHHGGIDENRRKMDEHHAKMDLEVAQSQKPGT